MHRRRLGRAAKVMPIQIHLLDPGLVLGYGLTQYTHQVWLFNRVQDQQQELPMHWILGLNPKQ